LPSMDFTTSDFTSAFLDKIISVPPKKAHSC
jgi:hypothetical protein